MLSQRLVADANIRCDKAACAYFVAVMCRTNSNQFEFVPQIAASNSVAWTMTFICHTRWSVAATCCSDMSLNINIVLFLHIKRVCKSFLNGKSDAYQQLICIMQRVHFQVRVGVFSCQDKYLFPKLWHCGKKTNWMWFSMVNTLIDNHTGHHSGQNFVDLWGAAK